MGVIEKRAAAAAAAVALFLLASPAHARDWRASFDTLLYADDDRVVVVTPQATLAVDLDEDGGELRARALVDVVSAASVDVISHATGGFLDRRTAAELAGSLRVGAWLPELRLSTSIEDDYRSYGVGASFERRLGGADSVLRVAWDGLYDQVGRTRTSFDVFSRTLLTQALELGLTQVLDPRTVVRGVYTLTLQDGYLEKPYRFVPLFDQAGLEAAAAAGDALDSETFDLYRLPERPPEEVPDLRVRHAFGLRGLRWLPGLGRGAALRADYRYYVDSWAMQAHTLELSVSAPLGGGFRASLRQRAHVQTSTSFWQREYVVGGAGELPRFRTLDRDLSSAFVDTASARLDFEHGAWRVYVDAGAQYARFFDFLLLEARTALLLQVGVRYQP